MLPVLIVVLNDAQTFTELSKCEVRAYRTKEAVEEMNNGEVPEADGFETWSIESPTDLRALADWLERNAHVI